MVAWSGSIEPSMKTIVTAIAENIDVRPELIERAIKEGFVERAECVVLTASGKLLLEAAEFLSSP